MNNQVSENPVKNRVGIDWHVVISALTITCYITANLMSVKLLKTGNLVLFDCGTIIFPLSYMLGDVMTEIWGFNLTKRIILLTFCCNIFLILFTYIGVFLPSPDYMQEINEAYKAIFCFTPRILVASLFGFLFGELSNSWSMELIKKLTKGKYLFVRTILSSAVGYIFDTLLFVVIAYYGVATLSDIFSMGIIQYFVKLGIEAIFATPIAYGVIAFLKKRI